MPYFRTCPHCGSNLDPGEKCDCQSQEKQVTIKRKPQRRAAATIKTRASTDRPLVLEARRKNA